MTTPQPLNGSPLWLHGHRFTEVSVRASALEKPTGQFALETVRSLGTHKEDPHKFRLTLTLRLGSDSPDKEAPYTATLEVEGDFEVAEAYSEAKRLELVNITGASMLYGACREMLANLTARSTHGMSTLPSVSFANPAAKPAAVSVKRSTKAKS